MRLIDTLYAKALKPILFRIHPDYVHDWFIALGEFSGKFALTRGVMSGLYEYRGKDISKTVDGITYRTPVLLSAGFDADGRLTRVLPHLSFGGEEIGSTTAYPCEGNPRPRMTRLIRNKSIVVYKGLRNQGVDALIARLKRTPRTPGYVLGISIARTNTKESCADNTAGIADFALSFKKLNEANIGDYYTINISCPNAFAGETFNTPELFAALLSELATIPTKKPVYIKMPINHSWEDFQTLLAIADKHSFIRGLVIGNLNKDYSELDHPEDAPKEFRGGLSGKPCFARSNDLIRRTREAYADRFTIIGVGGTLTPEDAMAKFAAGADLVQVITGMIWNGPGLMREICEAYARRQDPTS
jgi:dihydroorotate dehydrogenase